MNRLSRISVAALALALLPAGPAMAERPARRAMEAARISAIQDAATELQQDARDRLEPVAEGQVKVLQAVVMQVEGRCQWRPDVDAAWRNAKIDDLLEPGAMIRTGLRSKMTLRCGQNATILVDRSTRMTLPEVVQVGDTLQTAIALEHGRADFKVDKVGLTNDFTVVTPSTTLAVQGTGMSVLFGALKGTEVTGARTNEMNAIELRYFISRVAYRISGGGTSSDRHKNPAVAQLFKTFGPSPLLSALIEAEATAEQIAQELAKSPVYDQRLVDIVNQATDQVIDFIEQLPPPEMMEEPPMMVLPPDFGEIPEDAGLIAQIICEQLFSIVGYWSDFLIRDGLGNNNIELAESSIDEICQRVFMKEGMFTEQELTEIVQVVVEYCEQEHSPNIEAVNVCIEDFVEAVVTSYSMPPG